MSLLENLHTERKARLMRLGAIPSHRVEVKKAEPPPEAPKKISTQMEKWVERQRLMQRPQFWFSIEEEITERGPSIANIQVACAQHFGISRRDIIASRRTRDVVFPRQVAMYLAKMLTPRSLPEIGRHFGNRDHTTILYGVRKVAALVKSDWTVAYDVAHAEALL